MYKKLLLTLFLLVAVSSIRAENIYEDAYLDAEKVNYDKKNQMFIAEGNVKITVRDYIIIADKVIYSPKSKKIYAIKNVSLLLPSNEVIFTDYVEFNGKTKEVKIDSLKMRNKDNLIIASNRALIENKNKITFERVIYTPCKVCKNKKTLWQLKSKKTVLDKEKQVLSHENLRLEAFGVPVIYLPKITHATPNADRKTGFLTPQFSQEKLLGQSISMPYYVNLATNKDLVLTPTYYTKEDPSLKTKFRHLTKKGEYNVILSGTYPKMEKASASHLKARKLRGHLEANGRFNLAPDIFASFSAKKATDDTYLRKYFGDSDPFLTSEFTAERINKNHYGRIKSMSFQGLAPELKLYSTPIIIPVVDNEYHFDKKIAKGEVTIKNNFLVLDRVRGSSTRRVVTELSWNRIDALPKGILSEVNVATRMDNYQIDNLSQGNINGYIGRKNQIIPSMELRLAYPLLGDLGNIPNSQVILEPEISVGYSHFKEQIENIPNEDSREFLINEANLLNLNHFAGYDRVERGLRAAYALKSRVNINNHEFKATMGQYLHAKDDKKIYNKNSGMENRFSNYVMHLNYNYGNRVNLDYKTNINRNLIRERENISINLYMQNYSINTAFLAIRDPAKETPTKKELYNAFAVNMGPYSSARFYIRNNFNKKSGNATRSNKNLVKLGASYQFENECVSFITAFENDPTKYKDFKRNFGVKARLSLKTISF